MRDKFHWTWKKIVGIIAELLGIGTLVSCYKIERSYWPYREDYITAVGGTVTTEDSTPIKNILVESSADKSFTDENGYYEVRIKSNPYNPYDNSYNPYDNSNDIELKFTDCDDDENGGQFCYEKLSIKLADLVKQSNKFENNVKLQEMIKIRVGGIVISEGDEKPIKNIVVKSEIDRTVTDENGYYEIITGAKQGKKAVIEFYDDDLNQNGGKFSPETLEIALENDNTFENNITLRKNKYFY